MFRRPHVVLPIILGTALVVTLLAFAQVRRIIAVIAAFRLDDVSMVLLLLLAYEVVRGVQWHVMLRALGIRAPLRTQAVAFLGGEVAKTLPLGNYVQNYLLHHSTGRDFGRSSAATTLVILVEVTVSLSGLLILGLGPWTWLRPVILTSVIALLLIAGVGWAVHGSTHAPVWLRERQGMRAVLASIQGFRGGATALRRPPVLALVGALGAIYLLLAGGAFAVLLHGLGLDQVTFEQALAVYFFSLAVGLIIPIPVDIGLSELSGVAAVLAIGVEKNAALGAVLLYRVVSITVVLVIALVATALLRDEVRAVLRERPRRASYHPSCSGRRGRRVPWGSRAWSSAVPMHVPRRHTRTTSMLAPPRRRTLTTPVCAGAAWGRAGLSRGSRLSRSRPVWPSRLRRRRRARAQQ